ncbi:MAG: 3-dehydroquinate synthase, partial [Clostridia bacterium]|nr:3-dehydroquinate synthase [Clostridia bacterium]
FKNIVGAFYPPKAVIIDPETLKTLPARQISNGLAEALKMAMTSDKELFCLFESGNALDHLETVIERSILIKKSVVEQDERESGIRRVLNFGHTLAHAIEAENAMKNYYHGECVAIGMLAMCRKEVGRRLLPILDSLNLPSRLSCGDIGKIIDACRHDKKLEGDYITAVYVEEIGEYKLIKMPFSEFEKTIREALL